MKNKNRTRIQIYSVWKYQPKIFKYLWIFTTPTMTTMTITAKRWRSRRTIRIYSNTELFAHLWWWSSGNCCTLVHCYCKHKWNKNKNKKKLKKDHQEIVVHLYSHFVKACTVSDTLPTERSSSRIGAPFRIVDKQPPNFFRIVYLPTPTFPKESPPKIKPTLNVQENHQNSATQIQMQTICCELKLKHSPPKVDRDLFSFAVPECSSKCRLDLFTTPS